MFCRASGCQTGSMPATHLCQMIREAEHAFTQRYSERDGGQTILVKCREDVIFGADNRQAAVVKDFKHEELMPKVAGLM